MTTDQKHEEVMRVVLATQAEVRKLRAIVEGKEEVELWDKRRVAQELQCTPRHLNRLMERGELPKGGMIGSSRVWAADVIRRLAAERRKKAITRG